ncbi:LLM class flavin-dependent oxidoreductase [Paenibacillus dendritiformis]|uniref:LLM class flavin-dependent oxidoreductase n=1 Tax=Paenibacillus dendritiformis TaxID=130049 RepID=UPI003650D8B9
MKFGISFLPDCNPEMKSPEKWYEDALNIVELIDHYGFYSVKITEHFFNPYGGYCGNPTVFLTAAAMRSKHLKLITGCVLPVFHNPLNVASEIGMLDAISGGRAEVGFARAYMPYEFEKFGVSMNESRPRFVEFIKAVTTLWKEESASFEGDFFSFQHVSSMPRTVQRPHPPVWIAASATPESFRWAGKEGFHLMVVPTISDFQHFKSCLKIYKEEHEQAGHGEIREKFTLVYPMYIHEDLEKAHEHAKRYMKKYWRIWHDAASSWDNHSSEQYQNYSNMAAFLRQFTYTQLVDENRILVGTPEMIADKLKQISEEFGVEYFTFQVDFGGMPYSMVQESLSLFKSRVMPQLEISAAMKASS